jgi:DNA-binding transcriptional LysR family regulator
MFGIDHFRTAAVRQTMVVRPPDWMLCRSFLALLREGSLSRAGRRLGVTHSTIRRHLEEMEAAVGAPLFVRAPTGLTPTELALALRDPADAMESAFERLLRTARVPDQAIGGTVRITASEVMGAEVLPAMLARLRQNHPALEFELDLSDDVTDLLRCDADIAVRMTRPTQSALLAQRAAVVELGLYVHRGWMERQGAPPSLAALLRDRGLIGYDKAPTLIAALSAQGIALERRDFGVRSDSTLAQLGALRAGLGVGVCQVPIAVRDPALMRVFPEMRSELEVWVVSHPNLRTNRTVRACLDALVQDLERYAAGRASDVVPDVTDRAPGRGVGATEPGARSEAAGEA